LLTGQLPFEGPLAALCAQALTKKPEDPSSRQPGLDARLDVICLKALAKKPEQRFANTSSFVTALEEFLQTQGGANRTPTTITQPCPGLPLPSRLETGPSRGRQTATRPLGRLSRAGRRGLLVLVLLMIVLTGVWLGIHGWPSREEGPPEEKPLT